MTLFLNNELALKLEKNVRDGNQQLIKTLDNLLGSKSVVKSVEFDNVLAVYGGPECPLNGTVGLGMESTVDRHVLSKIEEFYNSNDYATVIRVCPLAHPSLIEITQERGYVLHSFSYRWVLDLSLWKSPFEKTDPRIRIADHTEEIEWARSSAAGFEDVDDIPDDYDLDLDRAFFRNVNNIPMTAIENDKIVAGGILELTDGIAALFATSTLPSYRKRGLQTALLDWRLRFAQERGARIATIETDPGSASQRNVERMGFKLAYVATELKQPLQSENRA